MEGLMAARYLKKTEVYRNTSIAGIIDILRRKKWR
jgi:hypothetical protein